MASPSNDFLSKDFIFLVQDGGNNNVFAHEHLKKRKKRFWTFRSLGSHPSSFDSNPSLKKAWR
jgi:hypothetical protein